MGFEHSKNAVPAPGPNRAVGDFSPRGLKRRRMRRLGRTWAWWWSVQTVSGAKRIFDITASLILLILFSPLLILVALLTRSRPVLRNELRVGRWCEPFQTYELNTEGSNGIARAVARIPILINILRGEMSFVGPRAVKPGELSPRDIVARRRYDVRPGLISLWRVRRSGNVDYESEPETDAEYIDTQSFRGDLGISLRAIPAAVFGDRVAGAPDELELLGIRIDNLTMTETVEQLLSWAHGSRARQLCFVNADCANIAWSRPEYREVLNTADLCVADGIGVKLAGKLLARPIKQNVNGTDLFPRLCAALPNDLPLFLLGARPGVAEAVRDWIHANYPNATVAGVQHGYFPSAEEKHVIDRIRSSGARILLVAFGAPRQDLWIRAHIADLAVGAALGVGGLFDFFSGHTPRAPQWMREIGLEWTYRLYQEPGRMWKRYLWGNLLFMGRVLRP